MEKDKYELHLNVHFSDLDKTSRANRVAINKDALGNGLRIARRPNRFWTNNNNMCLTKLVGPWMERGMANGRGGTKFKLHGSVERMGKMNGIINLAPIRNI